MYPWQNQVQSRIKIVIFNYNVIGLVCSGSLNLRSAILRDYPNPGSRL